MTFKSLAVFSQVLALADRDREQKDVGWADVYHSGNRYNVGPRAHLPVLLPSSVIYSFERQRLLLGSLHQQKDAFCHDLMVCLCLLGRSQNVMQPIAWMVRGGANMFELRKGASTASVLELRREDLGSILWAPTMRPRRERVLWLHLNGSIGCKSSQVEGKCLQSQSFLMFLLASMDFRIWKLRCAGSVLVAISMAMLAAMGFPSHSEEEEARGIDDELSKLKSLSASSVLGPACWPCPVM